MRRLAAALGALVALSGVAVPAGAQTLTQPGGTDAQAAPALAPACGAVGELYPSGHAGYGITTLDYISNGSLSDGATKVTDINAALCSVFQAPQDPQLTLPSSLFTNPSINAPLNPAEPQTAAVFDANEITYAPANITLDLPSIPLLGTLGLPSAGQLVLTPVPLEPSMPCVRELAAAGVAAPAACSVVEQTPVAAGKPGAGGFNLDIVTGAINTIYLPSVAAPLVKCTLAPADIPLTTNAAFLPAGSAASPITGPLNHALATVVSTPQFALPNVESCDVMSAGLGLVGATVATVVNTALHSAPATFTAPLLLQLSLTSGA